MYTPVKAKYSEAVSPLKGLPAVRGRKSPLRRAVEALLPTGVLDERGAKAELGRLFGASRERVNAMVWELRHPEKARAKWRANQRRRYTAWSVCSRCKVAGHSRRTCHEYAEEAG